METLGGANLLTSHRHGQSHLFPTLLWRASIESNLVIMYPLQLFFNLLPLLMVLSGITGAVLLILVLSRIHAALRQANQMMSEIISLLRDRR